VSFNIAMQSNHHPCHDYKWYWREWLWYAWGQSTCHVSALWDCIPLRSSML